MKANGDKLSVCVVQTDSGGDTEANLSRVEALAAAHRGVALIALPEVFAFRGSDDHYRARAEPVPGPITGRLARLARRMGAWVLAGSVIERAGDKIFNTSVLLDSAGALVCRYRKIHLFEAYLEDGRAIRERDAYEPGDRPVLAELGGWRCGMAICYDVRFPELFRVYAELGADLLFIPANFTQRTGRDHWEVLVRARAIENQCFVVAPNQCGVNPVTGVASHGHSLVVGPWGEVLLDAGAAEGACRVELDAEKIGETRRRVPALSHRRLPPAARPGRAGGGEGLDIPVPGA